LTNRGWEVFPEATIRRKGEKLAKVPDGLAVRGKQVLWLEVEQARKTGPSMRLLAEALVAVSAAEAEAVCGHRANIAACAYVTGATDENGHQLSHQLRVRSAIEKVARKDVSVMWLPCTLKRYGLVAMAPSVGIVEANQTSRILARLDAIGWKFNDEHWAIQYGKHSVVIWSGETEGSDEILWYFKVGDGPTDWARTLTEAKRGAAAVLGGISTE
jgi:hypothetical protein